MARDNLDAPKITDMVMVRGLKMETLSAVLAGSFTVNANMPPALFLDPNGASRSVVMPLETSSKGLCFIIVNTSAAATFSLNIRNNADNATLLTLTSGATLDLNETALVICDGTRWYGISATNP